MCRKKLLLINPVNPVRTGLTVNKSSRFPPLSLGIIAALTPSDWDVEIVDENWEPFVYREADLVGVTAFTASANRAYQIAGFYRERGIPVVAGGIHVSLCQDEALQYVDSIVVGEAESVWPGVIADFESRFLQKVYQGSWCDLSGLSKPRRDLFHPGYMFASVQTSRGCPMDCEFCSVTAFNGRRYRRRPPEEVLDELAGIPQKMLFFVDDNIIGYGADDREKALAIFKGMVERKMNKWWFCQASLNFADDEEVLYWAGKAGCKMVFLGLEAENREALAEANKRLNLKMGADSYKEAFQRINRFGIAVLGAFIYGMDSDTPESLTKRSHYILQSNIDVLQTTLMTPLPGTRLYNRLFKENRLLYTDFPKDWEHYDMAELLFQPKLMNGEELCLAKDAGTALWNKPGQLLIRFLKTLSSTRSFTTAMWALSSNLNYRKVGKTQILDKENYNYTDIKPGEREL